MKMVNLTNIDGASDANGMENVLFKKDKMQRLKFQLSGSKNGVLFKIHHTVFHNGQAMRIRFTNACFSQSNERFVAVDHRCNLFVFDFSSCIYWVISNLMQSIVCIENIPGTNEFILGNKEGLLLVFDSDTGAILMRLKAHHTPIERISFPRRTQSGSRLGRPQKPKLQTDNGAKSTVAGPGSEQRARPSKTMLFLVTTLDCAILYNVRNFVRVHQLNYGKADSLKRIDQLQWIPKTDHLLLGCGLDGTVQIWNAEFKLVRELNLKKMKDNFLKKFSPMVITGNIREEGDLCDQGDSSRAEIERVIRSMTSSGQGSRFVKTARFAGKFLLLYCVDNSLVVVKSDVWQICKVLAFTNLFITQFDVVEHVDQNSAVGLVVVAKTVDSDLLLMNLEDGTRRCIVRGPENKCYKFLPSRNGKMLANVLKSGQVLLHNLEFHSCALKANKLQHLATGKTHPRPLKTTTASGASVTSRAAVNCNLASQSSGGSLYSSSGTSVGSTSVQAMTTGQSTSVFRKESKLKTDRRLEEIHDKISKTLVKTRLLPILKEFGEYPEKHRATIWRALLDLPQNVDCFNALLLRGNHPCVEDYDRRFSGLEARTVRNVKKTVSCLAHWSAVFAQCDFVPFFVQPFVRMYPNDSLLCFELVATILLNQGQLWFEYAPLEPMNYLGLVENVLCEYEPSLMNVYRERNISSRVYALTVMEMAFAANFNVSQWTQLWDHVLSNESYFMIFFIVAYNAAHRATIMSCATEAEVEAFFREPALISINKLLKRTYDVMDRCPENVHPKYYMKSFVSLGAGGVAKRTNLDGRQKCYEPNQAQKLGENHARSTYSKFSNFPKQFVDTRVGEMDSLKAQQEQLEAKIVAMEKLEHSLKKRLVDGLVREEHDKRMREVEAKYEEALATEEQRIAMQRKLLLLHKKHLRDQENEALLESRNSLLRQNTAAREFELKTLLRTLQHERQREETDLISAEEDLKHREMALVARLYSDRNTKLVDDRSLEQRYQQAIQQLDRQKQKLYEDIERVTYYDTSHGYSSALFDNGSTDEKFSTASSDKSRLSRQSKLKDYETKIHHLTKQLEVLRNVNHGEL